MNKQTEKAIKIATQWYTKGKLAHALRVASYAMEEATMLSYGADDKETIFQIALLHDIIEDTECPQDVLIDLFTNRFACLDALDRLTHLKGESYEDYILRLSKYTDGDMEQGQNKDAIAFTYIIKRADMKDHLMREEPESDRLKNKYFPAIKNIL